MTQAREHRIKRKTNETQIDLLFGLDGDQTRHISTGIPFFDHMLDLFGKHGHFNLDLTVKGDIEVDYHHTVEDVGICLGQAFRACLGDCKGITRYASLQLPMDEALCGLAVDISNRPFLHFTGSFPQQKTGGFDAELVEEFFRAFAFNAKLTLHVNLLYGQNVHHIIEGCFKGLGVVLHRAILPNPYSNDIPSTKGIL